MPLRIKKKNYCRSLGGDSIVWNVWFLISRSKSEVGSTTAIISITK